MTVDDAVGLIAGAVPRGGGGTWADLGAGGGTFTRALVRLLGGEGRVHAVDVDRRAMDALRLDGVGVTTHVADFARGVDLPPLDGVLIANALHYVRHDEQARVLADVVAMLRPAGRLVVVEYENRAASRWVPYPVPFARLAEILPPDARPPLRVGERRSAYGGTMYAAWSAAPASDESA